MGVPAHLLKRTGTGRRTVQFSNKNAASGFWVGYFIYCGHEYNVVIPAVLSGNPGHLIFSMKKRIRHTEKKQWIPAKRLSAGRIHLADGNDKLMKPVVPIKAG